MYLSVATTHRPATDLGAELKRNSRYVDDDFRRLKAEPPIEAAPLLAKLRQAVADAGQFVSAMPTDRIGQIFLEAGRPVRPDPARLDRYVAHAPQRRGHWPSAPEISSAMLERLQQPGP